MCRTRNVPTRMPPKRWTSSRANRGQCLIDFLPVISSTIVTFTERRTYATTPPARAAYQSTGLEVRCTGRLADTQAPCGVDRDLVVGGQEPSRDPLPVEPCG